MSGSLPRKWQPQAPAARLKANEVYLVSNGDLRESANKSWWPTQQELIDRLHKVMKELTGRKPSEKEKLGFELVRANSYKEKQQHGFISSVREGSDVFARMDPQAPVIVLVSSWQYSHHIASSLLHHQGPVLLLANFDGTWPGLVGMLNLSSSLSALGRDYSRLWSQGFDDAFFYDGLARWLTYGKIEHPLHHLHAFSPSGRVLQSEAGQLGTQLGQDILRRKEVMGLFDNFCMGMLNSVFPQPLLAQIGMPMEGLSQSALLHEMSLVGDDLREECLRYYEKKGMTFHFGKNEETELTRAQVKQQCAMLIVLARVVERFGFTAIGTQYQQGLKDCCPASDFAEGALGSSDRFPIPDYDGHIIRPGQPIPHINEVDMGSGIPQIMMFRLLQALGQPSETTLHDLRWGSEFQGKFYWDFEISGAVPFEHIEGGIAGAQGHRQPAMYFPLGGSTIGGQCKAGTFIWARAFYQDNQVKLHLGSGRAYLLPKQEFERRLKATNPEWPLMNATLDGIDRDQMMAGQQGQHLTIAYVEESLLPKVVTALAVMGKTLGIQVILAGNPPLAG